MHRRGSMHRAPTHHAPVIAGERRCLALQGACEPLEGWMNPVADPDDACVEKCAASGVRWMTRRHAAQDVHDAAEGNQPGMIRARWRRSGMRIGVQTEAANLVHGAAGEARSAGMRARLAVKTGLATRGVRVEHHADTGFNMSNRSSMRLTRFRSITRLARPQHHRSDCGVGTRTPAYSDVVICVERLHAVMGKRGCRVDMDRCEMRRPMQFLQGRLTRLDRIDRIENHAICRSSDRTCHRARCRTTQRTKIRGRQMGTDRAIGIEHPSSLAASLATIR